LNSDWFQNSALEDEVQGLVNEYNVPGAAAEEVLGFDDDDEEEGCDGDRDDLEETASDMVEVAEGSDENFDAFQMHICIKETQCAKQNRRPGGIKTQNAMVKAWEVCRYNLFSISSSSYNHSGICSAGS
jgi:hypothetical protein